jgi:hypothetical protein
LSEAQLAFQRALSATNTDESNLVNSLYGDYLATAPPATPAAAAAAAAKPPLTAAQKAAAEADRKARIAKAQAHLKQDKINAAKKKAAKPAAKKKATIGSSAGSVRGIG